MKLMITISLVLNVVVLIPVCAGLLTNAEWVQAAYGPGTPARSILLAVYFAILMSSTLLLGFMDVKFVAALLFVQVAYKLMSPLTVVTFHNPVVLSNIAIAIFHLATLVVIWRAGQGQTG